MTLVQTAPAAGGGDGRRRVTHRRALVAALVGVAALGGAFLAGWLPRHLAHLHAVHRATAEEAPPRVSVVPAASEGTGRELTLPGGLVANQRTLIYARVQGYVRRWLVDIGDHVRKDQVLAELETPDLDQDLSQAEATLAQRRALLAQAETNRAYARLSASRQDYLVHRNLVAQQDADYANTQAAAATDNVTSARADVHAQHDAVRRLEDFVAFSRVTAPFDGTVTQRFIEVGSLVNAGKGTASEAMFQVEATDPLRVFIRVPQTFAPSVRVGETADVTVLQYPGRKFTGKVTRTAGALDPTSRTLETEVVVPNGSGALQAGMYCEVTIRVAVSHRIVRVPASAVLFDASGVHVATLGDDGRVHIVLVQLGRNLGNNVEIVEGLEGGEKVLSAPPLDLSDGMQVQPVGG